MDFSRGGKLLWGGSDVNGATLSTSNVMTLLHVPNFFTMFTGMLLFKYLDIWVMQFDVITSNK